MRTYEEAAYAAERLVNTIVRYNGKAVKIITIDMDGGVALKYLVSGRNDVCKLADLDITPVPLGYVNVGTYATYVSRSPVRRDWKQGLRTNTMRCTGDRFRPEEIPNKSLALAIENVYPSLNDAFSAIDAGVNAMAFSRDFALIGNRGIMYKGIVEVGNFLDKKDKRYHLNDNAKWLLESLEEVVNG